jgi:hypothetical protein
MISRLRKLALVLPALFVAVALGACGESHMRVTTGTYAGEQGANAPYLDVGPLSYQVQLSRQLNPTNPEDAAYLQGLSAQELTLEKGQEWFAVFVQVYNTTPHPLQGATGFTITDTQGNTYSPIIPTGTNPYAYRGGEVPAEAQLPIPDTIASAGPTQGALLLFKVQIVSLDSRPIVLKILDPENPTESASAELDV